MEELRWKTVSWDDHTTPPLCVTVLIDAHTPLPPIILDTLCTLETSQAELNIDLNRAKQIQLLKLQHANLMNSTPNVAVMVQIVDGWKQLCYWRWMITYLTHFAAAMALGPEKCYQPRYGTPKIPCLAWETKKYEIIGIAGMDVVVRKNGFNVSRPQGAVCNSPT